VRLPASFRGRAMPLPVHLLWDDEDALTALLVPLFDRS
jgi:hypothetical protein